MSAESPEQPGDPTAAAGRSEGAASERELQAAYEAELSRITATDMIAQAAVSLLNIGARRLAGSRGPGTTGAGSGAEPSGGADAAPQRDLDQVRDAIDATRALLGILERTIPRELGPLRDALSQLQIAYARELGGAGGAGVASGAGGEPPTGAPGTSPTQGEDAPAAGDAPSPGGQKPGPGPAESSGRLWVPGR